MTGRGWPTPGEPLFLQADTQLALAWQSELDGTCGGCGNPRDESMSADNQDAYTVRRLVCHACAASAHAQHKASDPDAARSDSDGVYLVPVLDQ